MTEAVQYRAIKWISN